MTYSDASEFVSELRGLPNVILTPHIGGSTEEAQQDIGRYVAGKLRDFVVDGSTTTYSNLVEEHSDRTLSSFGITVHMLSQGDEFDLSTRTPSAHPADSMEETEEKERGTGTE